MACFRVESRMGCSQARCNSELHRAETWPWPTTLHRQVSCTEKADGRLALPRTEAPAWSRKPRQSLWKGGRPPGPHAERPFSALRSPNSCPGTEPATFRLPGSSFSPDTELCWDPGQERHKDASDSRAPSKEIRPPRVGTGLPNVCGGTSEPSPPGQWDASAPPLPCQHSSSALAFTALSSSHVSPSSRLPRLPFPVQGKEEQWAPEGRSGQRCLSKATA